MDDMRKMSFLLGLFLTCLTPSPSMAQSDEEMCRLYEELLVTQNVIDNVYPKLKGVGHCRGLYWGRIIPKPLDDMLEPKERASYDAAIIENRCNDALNLLAKRFYEKHPNLPSILDNRENLRRWSSRTIPHHYQDLGLCLELQKIDEAQSELDRRGTKTRPYFRDFVEVVGTQKTSQMTDAEKTRHWAVFGIFQLSLHGARPKWDLALLKLSLKRVAAHFHPDYEYVLAYRAKKAGLKDPVIGRVLSRPLVAGRASFIREIVETAKKGSIPIWPDG